MSIRYLRHLRALVFALVPLTGAVAQREAFTRADTLRGSITPERAWWDVTFYDLHVTISPMDSTLRGWNGITYRVVGSGRDLQIDLQKPLAVDSIVQDGRRLTYRREGNAVFAKPAKQQPKGTLQTLTVYYHGTPKIATNPPWNGGVVWARDPSGQPWVGTACQLDGASIWWPTKDTQADEPDSQRIALTVPDSLQAISNGHLRGVQRESPGWSTYEWFVTNPINNYGVAAYVGRYARIDDVYEGEGGRLPLTFWPLPAHLEAARTQFQQVKPMLACFEHWFGPYPWYRDGYQLVEAPYLGMEHQSAVAYGNGYVNGYQGNDRSGTGLGSTWDYIIVHESGHEWFGNNLTTADIADMWVHEGFTTYSEAIFVECQNGPADGASYVIGLRAEVQHDRPIIGPYGVHAEGSSDMYSKGANMLHTIRHIIGNDTTWRNILRGLNATLGHKVITGQEVEAYISTQAGMDLSKVFAQYLTTTQIPVFEYRIEGQTLSYRWVDVVPGFDMPLRVKLGGDRSVLLKPQESWQTTTISLADAGDFKVDENFYVTARRTQ